MRLNTGIFVIGLLVFSGIVINPVLGGVETGYVNINPTGDSESGMGDDTVTQFQVSPGELQGDIGTITGNVKKLQDEITAVKADGIDTTKADQKVKDASDSLARASNEDFADAKSEIQNAERYIKDANGYLDMSIAQRKMGDAREVIDRADQRIAQFKNEKGMETDPRLAPIITKREFAAEYLADAQESYDQGKYADARLKAEEADKKATDVFDDTQNLNDDLNRSNSRSSGTEFIAPIIMLILIVIAVISAYKFGPILLKKNNVNNDIPVIPRSVSGVKKNDTPVNLPAKQKPEISKDPIIINHIKEILTQYGPPTERNQAQFKGMMQDLLVDHEREYNLLFFVLERGYVTKIMQEKPAMVNQFFIRKCSDQLRSSWGMEENASEWALKIWIQALNLERRSYSEGSVTHQLSEYVISDPIDPGSDPKNQIQEND